MQPIKFEDKYGDTFVLDTTEPTCAGCAFEYDKVGCQEANDACCIVEGIWVRD